MASIHILEKEGGLVHVIVHQAVPGGSNSSAVTWKNVLIGSGQNTTVMVEGTGAGQITTTEKASILAGDVVEIDLQVQLFSGGVTLGQINALITAAVNAWLQGFQERYAHFGRTI